MNVQEAFEKYIKGQTVVSVAWMPFVDYQRTPYAGYGITYANGYRTYTYGSFGLNDMWIVSPTNEIVASEEL